MRALATLVLAALASALGPACGGSEVVRVELPGAGPTTVIVVGTRGGTVVDRTRPLPTIPGLDDDVLERDAVWAVDYGDTAARLGLRIGAFAGSAGGLGLPSPARGAAQRLELADDGGAPRWVMDTLPAALDELRFDFGSGMRPTAGCHAVESELVALRDLPDAPFTNASYLAPIHGRMWVGLEDTNEDVRIEPAEANTLIIDAAGQVERTRDPQGGPVLIEAAWFDAESDTLWRVYGSTLSAHRLSADTPTVVGDAQVVVPVRAQDEFRFMVGRRSAGPAGGGELLELQVLAFDGTWIRYRATVGPGGITDGAQETIGGCPIVAANGAGGLAMSPRGDVVAALTGATAPCYLPAGGARAMRVDVGAQVGIVGVAHHPTLGFVVADDEGMLYAHTPDPASATAPGTWRPLTERATTVAQAGQAILPVDEGLLAGGSIGTIAEWRPDVGWCPQLPSAATQTVRLLAYLDERTFFSTGTIPGTMLEAPLPIVVHRIVP